MKKSGIWLTILIFAVASSIFLVKSLSPKETSEVLSREKGSEFDESQQSHLETDLYAGARGLGYKDGEQLDALFRIPQGIVSMPDGSAIVADTKNHLLRIIVDGEVNLFAGIDFLVDDEEMPLGALYDETLEIAAFNEPVGLAHDVAGDIYVADSYNHAIRKINIAEKTVVTIAGNGVIGSVDGVGEEAQFYHPLDVVVSDEGMIYVADTLNHVIRKITPNGEVSTLNAMSDRVVDAGEIVYAGGWQDGALNEALFNEPSALALDDTGNLYVSDTGNQLIRYIDLEKEIVSTVAGVIPKEDLYMTDALYAPGGFQDGAAEQAQFNFPRGLALTKEGGLVIADSLNHAIRYLHDGNVRTISGSTADEFGSKSGTGTESLLHMPTDVTITPNGDILIVDAYNNQIKIISEIND